MSKEHREHNEALVAETLNGLGRGLEMCKAAGVNVSEAVQVELDILLTVATFLIMTREMAMYDVSAATDDPREAGLNLPKGYLVNLNHDLRDILDKYVGPTTEASKRGAAKARAERENQ